MMKARGTRCGIYFLILRLSTLLAPLLVVLVIPVILFFTSPSPHRMEDYYLSLCTHYMVCGKQDPYYGQALNSFLFASITS